MLFRPERNSFLSRMRRNMVEGTMASAAIGVDLLLARDLFLWRAAWASR